MDSIRNYLGEKEFRVSEILQFSIMLLLAGFLIGGGIIILNDEDIFKKIYEGYQGQLDSDGPDPLPGIGTTTVSSSVSRLLAGTAAVGTAATGTPAVGTVVAGTAATGTAAVNQRSSAVSNTWTADLPDELLLVNLQKNVKLIRKTSLINTITAWTMIILGSLISIYQIYNLFFS